MSKLTRRQKIKHRIRNKVHGNEGRPRLSVFRSNKEIYCQIINDDKCIILTAACSKGLVAESKTDVAKQVGKIIGERAIAAGVSNVVFDRNGYLYHGRIKSLAEGAREAGLQF